MTFLHRISSNRTMYAKTKGNNSLMRVSKVGYSLSLFKF